jgi:hypothetical protein
MNSTSPSDFARRRGGFAQQAALAADAKYGPESDMPCEHAARLLAALHAAVACARDQKISRRDIERRAGMGRSTLDDFLSAKPTGIRFDQLARLMLDPGVLGERAHAVLMGEVAIAMGRKVLSHARAAGAEDLPVEFMDVVDAAGALAEDVREAQHPDSPGGERITPMEHVSIGSRAGVVAHEAAQMMPGRDA